MYAKPIQQLIQAFRKLPSVGERTAERFVFQLLKSGKKDVSEITLALKNLMASVKSCEMCWDFSDRSPCPICADPKRDHGTIAVVAEPQDIQVMERTGVYRGTYHVLRGLIRADDDESLTRIKSKELLRRVSAPEVGEIMFALNPDLAGETTTMYLEREIRKQNPNMKLTRLARGLPLGSDLQYADDTTLESAIKYRTNLR